MVISSLIVEVYPEQVESACSALAAIEGVEVHEVIDDYKVIVSLEADTVDDSYEIANTFINIDGVFGVNLAYYDFAEDETIYPEGAEGLMPEDVETESE